MCVRKEHTSTNNFPCQWHTNWREKLDLENDQLPRGLLKATPGIPYIHHVGYHGRLIYTNA